MGEEVVQFFPCVVLYPSRGSVPQDLSNMALAVQKRDEHNTTVSVFLKPPSTDENLLIFALSIRLHTHTQA